MWKNCFLTCLAFVGLFACGPQARLDAEEHAIINGQLDTSAAHQAVVMVSFTTGRCTGTLISPTVVMTAGHCAEDDSPNDYVVRFGNSWGDSRAVGVSDFLRHPNYQPDPVMKNDIALLRLAESAPGNVRCIPNLTEALELAAEDIGVPLELVGFGITEWNANDYGVKRTVTLPLHGICTSLGGCQISLRGSPYSVGPNTISYDQLDAGTCMGDSGGPSLVTRGDKQYVAGITSIVWGECNMLACGTKVDTYQQWIDDYVGSDSVDGQACCADGQCMSGHCVDGICCENACDIPCYSCPKGSCVPLADGAACDDQEPCNGADSCAGGVCISGNTPPACNPPSPCQTGRCEPGVGCVFDPKTNGTDCNNANLCDGPDTCQAGQCQPAGSALDCDDDNVCTSDSCDPYDGCRNLPVADGTSCADSDRCDGAEACVGGACTSPDPLDCDDQNSCTEDSCDSSSGCQHQQQPEGYACASGRSCQGGLCLPQKGGCSTSANGDSLSFLCLVLLVLRRRPGGVR